MVKKAKATKRREKGEVWPLTVYLLKSSVKEFKEALHKNSKSTALHTGGRTWRGRAQGTQTKTTELVRPACDAAAFSRPTETTVARSSAVRRGGEPEVRPHIRLRPRSSCSGGPRA
jgi:hypothetical protein